MNKLSDNEIINALECCAKDDCESCPLSDYDGCKSLLFDGNTVIDLINRQKAEIERLMPYGIQVEVSKKIEKKIKSEAIKEFADRLKLYSCSYDLDNYHSFRAVDVDSIDNLVKEMIGEKNV